MTAKKLQLTLITGRTIDQGVGKEMGKGSQEYFDTAAVCFLDKADLAKLGIKRGASVQVTSRFGSVIVKAIEYPRGVQPGLAFIPCGLWANAVCGDTTFSMGMPLFKGFPVEVEPAPGKPVLTVDELLREEYGKEIP
jgi:formylmethanofuran dehydrogenase subunit D